MFESLLLKERQLAQIGVEYKAVLYSMAEAVVILNSSGKILHMNEMSEKITGWTETEATGMELTKLVLLQQRNGEKNHLPGDFLSGNNEKVFFQELEIISRAGDKIPIAGSLTKIRNQEGEPAGVVIVFRDQTEELGIQKELINSEARYRELNTTKDKLFSIIAHDLKNPFNSIIGMSEVLMVKSQEKDIDTIQRWAHSIHSASYQAYRLLENLLDWSLSQTGQLQFLPKRVDLRSTVDQVFSIHRELAAQKEIRLENLVTENLYALADKTMLHTILRNLIINAIKFSNVGGHVWVGSTVEKGDEKNQIVIFVKDNGVGIDPGSAEKLFEIGSTSRGTTNEKGKGLGLVLCKEFVEKHSGRIWAVGEPEKGSTFYFTIPKFTKPNNFKLTQTENYIEE